MQTSLPLVGRLLPIGDEPTRVERGSVGEGLLRLEGGLRIAGGRDGSHDLKRAD